MEATMHELSARDQEHLLNFERKMQVPRDRFRQVARGRSTGCFMWGNGGIGKSFLAEEVLREEGVSRPLSNSRLTGRALFDVLRDHPSAVHVIEDVEKLFRDDDALGVLRSATWGQRRDGDTGPMERLVTWGVKGWGRRASSAQEWFVFTGGLIVLANSRLPETPGCRAFSSRIHVLHLDLTEDEVAAKIRELAGRGYEYQGLTATPDECVEVAEYVIDQSQALGRRLNLRQLHLGVVDYLCHRSGETGCDWRHLVRTSLCQETVWSRQAVTVRKAIPKEELRRIVAEIASQTSVGSERIALWVARTGAHRATFYRYLSAMSN
jgi:hypothetical protein